MSAPDPEKDPNTGPRAEYSRRLERVLKLLQRKDRLHVLAGNFKVLTLVAGAIIVWLVWADHLIPALWLILPAAVYAALAVFHGRILRARARQRRIEAFYHRGISRIDDKWAGGGDTGEKFRDPKSVYADDIDIFGKGSLFELLSTARTPMGAGWLAGWLSSPSPLPAIRERQKLILELRNKLDLRERLSVIGEEMSGLLDAERLRQWSASRADPFHFGLRFAAGLLAAAALAALFYAFPTSSYLPLIIVLAVEAVFIRRVWKRAKFATQGMGADGKGLRLLSEIACCLENEEFRSPRLHESSRELRGRGQRASQAIRRLATLADWIDARDSTFIKIIELPLLYTVQVGLAAEQWRRSYGSRVTFWLEFVAEMEALLSLSAYSFEHPEDPFPELIAPSNDEKPVFEGEELGHPLIPASRCVRNSLRLGRESPVFVVSGSNMSGKSTFLRTVGINAVLAMAGAPVRARRLRLSPLTVGARIRTTDSLQEGRSRFYAEILRIRKVLDLTRGELPLLFLLDELLEGTNSKDRRVGAEGLVRSLLSRGAIGIVTTHDLALTAISSVLGNSIHNVHFQERIENGDMSFDYMLREGVVETSNALELMRWIGLEV